MASGAIHSLDQFCRIFKLHSLDAQLIKSLMSEIPDLEDVIRSAMWRKNRNDPEYFFYDLALQQIPPRGIMGMYAKRY